MLSPADIMNLLLTHYNLSHDAAEREFKQFQETYGVAEEYSWTEFENFME